MHGRGPGLDSSHLYEDRDLAVTTDFRDIFAEILEKRIGLRDLKHVFPGYEFNGRTDSGLSPDRESLHRPWCRRCEPIRGVDT